MQVAYNYAYDFFNSGVIYWKVKTVDMFVEADYS